MPYVRCYENKTFNPETCLIDGITASDYEDMREGVRDGFFMILKRVVPKDRIVAIRGDTMAFFENPENEGNKQVVVPGVRSFFRTYERPIRSKVKQICKTSYTFYWNQPMGAEHEVFNAISVFRNRLAGYNDRYSINEVDDGWTSMPSITQYPAGGGMLNMHRDPTSKNYCNILLAMTEKGCDYREGGLYLQINGETINADQFLGVGDIYFFRPDIPHGVSPIDPNCNGGIDWTGDSGRWIMVPALGFIEALNGGENGGFEDLEQTA